MKISYKRVFAPLITLLLIGYNIVEIVNLSLNKKYVVDEISSTQKVTSLVGMQNIIQSDYIMLEWLLLGNSLFILTMYLIRRRTMIR
jgi:hypothetical protein